MQEGHELRAISYAFGAIDNYSIELMATTDRGCTASAFDTIYMRPYIRNITDGEPYMEDFEGNAAGWFAFKSQTSPQMSWTISDRILNGDPVIHTSVADLLKSRNLSMLVYPNPASDHTILAFDGALPGPVEIQMFSHTGRLVLNKLLPSGTELYEMDLGGLEGGVYLVRAIRDGKVIGTCKLLILR